MKSLQDLNPHQLQTTSEIDENLAVLFGKIQRIQESYGKNLVITSGLRSRSNQEVLIKAGKSTATQSKHLFGQAADIYDPFGNLQKWIHENEALVEDLDVYFEDFNHTSTWVHIQIVPPISKKRFFIP